MPCGHRHITHLEEVVSVIAHAGSLEHIVAPVAAKVLHGVTRGHQRVVASDSGSRADIGVIEAMFLAALADFPQPALSPRRVTVPLAR